MIWTAQTNSAPATTHLDARVSGKETSGLHLLKGPPSLGVPCFKENRRQRRGHCRVHRHEVHLHDGTMGARIEVSDSNNGQSENIVGIGKCGSSREMDAPGEPKLLTTRHAAHGCTHGASLNFF